MPGVEDYEAGPFFTRSVCAEARQQYPQEEPNTEAPCLSMMNPDQVKQVIYRALADRCLSRAEREDILAAVRANGEITPELCGLWRELQERVFRGEIRIDRY